MRLMGCLKYLKGHAAALMEYIVACPDPERLAALCAFADHLATLPDPRDPRGVRPGRGRQQHGRGGHLHARPPGRLWLPLGQATPSRDTYLRLVRRLDPETAMQAALWLLDGTRLPGLRVLILALDGKVARRSGDPTAGTRALHMVSRLPGAGRADPGPGAVRGQEPRDHGHPPPARPHGPGGDPRHH